MSENKKPGKPLTSNQKEMLRRRGIDPRHYMLLKSTYTSLYLRDLRDGKIKILYKWN